MTDIKDDQLFVTSLNNRKKQLHDNPFIYQSILLNLVVPDTGNTRLLPAVFIQDEHALLFSNRVMTKKQLLGIYHAQGYVMIGKSCMINCLEYGSSDWKRANQTIESIIELSHNVSVSELIQAPTVYPTEDSKYKVLTGHRRFFALVYARGLGSAAQFKLYLSKSLLIKVKQFQENANREDLPQYEKLKAFINAISEIKVLNKAWLKVGLRELTTRETAANLGISMGAYDNYDVLTRYPSIIKAYQAELTYPFVKTKSIALEVESHYKTIHDKTVLNTSDRKKIDNELSIRLHQKLDKMEVTKKFKFKPIKSAATIKALLTTNLMELDLNIDWDDVDWDDHYTVSDIMTTVIEYLDS